MKEELKMAETVMIIDASFLDYIISDVKKNFERMLNRELQDVDLSYLMTYLALDADVKPGEKEIQVLLIYDMDSLKFHFCHPSLLQEELNNVAFSNAFGEFSFFSFQPEQLISLREFYLESLKLVADAKEVKKLIVISNDETDGNEVADILKRTDGKEIIQFRMDKPEQRTDYRWEVLAYPVMQALGITGEELGMDNEQ